ncbi:PadR family transcriptional regulator [Klebsiella quasipneumoniae]|uniref:PadR family transcriptional regulator n=1 Tax=Klebsiella quasipneumoniae TaxID=1463165 RepID=UPI00292C8DB6|nr:helix-turn-helix transcriptional regulator [Klebsiella quasipneumoniae]MDV0824986.1 helix-turn-helix transcriptional regulator [Klebsiella quasipneumoniae subsp. similipneumoniae]
MTDKDLYGGLIRLHILHHAAEEPVFGLGIIEELRRHGYEMSAGTVYPMLHGLEKKVLRGILGKWKLTDRVLVNWLSPNTPPPSPCCRRASY